MDSCAFDPRYAPEDEAAQEIRRLANEGGISVLYTHSLQKEIDHPNTPEDVKREAQTMNFTIATDLAEIECTQRAKIHQILTGNGNPEKYAADAAHIFEAGRYIGYFITTDRRSLGRKDELLKVCIARVVTPREWRRV